MSDLIRDVLAELVAIKDLKAELSTLRESAMRAREALELIAAPQRLDGTWNRDREACRRLAAEALKHYDDAILQHRSQE